jgi:hypothetical protein
MTARSSGGMRKPLSRMLSITSRFKVRVRVMNLLGLIIINL